MSEMIELSARAFTDQRIASALLRKDYCLFHSSDGGLFPVYCRTSGGEIYQVFEGCLGSPHVLVSWGCVADFDCQYFGGRFHFYDF